MNKIVTCAFVLGWLFALTLGAVYSKSNWTVRGASTIIVPDDYSTIQEAINNAADGDMISVKAGTYYEHIVVSKTVSIVGEDADTTIIDGNDTGHVINVVSDNVSISGFMVQNSGNVHMPNLDAGICLNGTTGCTISENRAINNGFCGISLLYSNGNTITDNNLSSAGWGGIHLLNSSYNTISGNTITDKYGGINGHVSSNYNNITENTISNCTYGGFYHAANYNNIFRNNISDIAVEGIELQDQVNYNIVAENNLNNCIVGIKLIGPNYNNIISGNFLTSGQSGIRIQNAGYTEICNNTIVHNYGGEWDAGIRLDSAGYARIHSNLITDNWRGILLYTTSPHVSIYSNNITENEFGVRVASGGSNYLNMSDNIIMNNRGYGIGLTGFGGASNYATITRNLIVNNSDGIALGQYSNYNKISQNNISMNDYGFYIESSTQNFIHGNTILNNAQQAYVVSGSVNTWDDGYPSGGNYWSDYTGTDVFSGPYQNETGSDGIGDTSYVIDSNNVDKYPHGPYRARLIGDINFDGKVDVKDLVLFTKAFGTDPTHSRWNPAADFNNDNKVDIKDLVLTIKHYGEHYP
jgi:parallel beta-helix repeat protein